MQSKGITFDTGFFHLGGNTREQFVSDVVEREMRVIRDHLHCSAVRIMGEYPERLELAARHAINAGLEVWLSPVACNLDMDDFLALFLDCADRAQRLRKDGAAIVFVAGSELSLCSTNFLPGGTLDERASMIATLKPGSCRQALHVPVRLNEFLAGAVSCVRERFGGCVTYASLPFEGIDWGPFDIVSSNGGYCLAEPSWMFRERLRALIGLGKPVALTEFGCATYRNAADRVGSGKGIVEYRAGVPVGLDGDYIRDEAGQAAYFQASLRFLEAEGVDHVFVNTFASYSLPHRDDPRADLDMASCGLVKILESGGTSYPGMAWEPKLAFSAVADCYCNAGNGSKSAIESS